MKNKSIINIISLIVIYHLYYNFFLFLILLNSNIIYKMRAYKVNICEISSNNQFCQI